VTECVLLTLPWVEDSQQTYGYFFFFFGVDPSERLIIIAENVRYVDAFYFCQCWRGFHCGKENNRIQTQYSSD
jgi:hypothetical protein